MAGTDSSISTLDTAPLQPAIILVEPQLAENIGSAARAMLNCALTDLRLVAPRDGWPNPAALPMASGADSVLGGARLFATVEEAVADLHFLFATTARRRDMQKGLFTPRRAAAEIRQRAASGERCGILFGRERIGLTNDEVALADAVLTVPLNPAFSSLNLGQSVLLLTYEYFQAGLDQEPPEILERESRRANREEMLGFFDHFERALDASGFFRSPDLRPTQIRNLRNVFHRADLTEQEVRSLHGVVAMLSGRRRSNSVID